MGFQVRLPPHTTLTFDPVSALRSYICRTASHRPATTKPVFLSLLPPYTVMSASQIAAVLNDAIKLAGLGGRGYTAKYFRPTGVTCAVSAGVDPEVVRKAGRWKTSHVFYEHYVHRLTPALLTESTIPI